jgi:hypothetical protein
MQQAKSYLKLFRDSFYIGIVRYGSLSVFCKSEKSPALATAFILYSKVSVTVNTVHRQNVEVKNAYGKKRRRTIRRIGQNVDRQNVEW